MAVMSFWMMLTRLDADEAEFVGGYDGLGPLPRFIVTRADWETMGRPVSIEISPTPRTL